MGHDQRLVRKHAAELVEDPALAAEPLANPGKVIRRVRGTAEEQLAALAESPSKRRGKAGGSAPRKPAPRPSRAKLDQAERAMADAEQRHERAMAKIRREEEKLAEKKHKLVAAQESERRAQEDQAETARNAYEAALTEWRS